MSKVDEIKKWVNIVDLASEYVCTPTSDLKIPSIYKKEKHPSLRLYPEQNKFHCFSTGKGGDVINFYADIFNMDLPRAIKELSKRPEVRNKNYNRDRKSSKVSTSLNEGNRTNIVNSISLYDGIVLTDMERTKCERIIEGMIKDGINFNDAKEYTIKRILQDRPMIQTKVYGYFAEFCEKGGFSADALNYLTGPQRGLSKETIKKFRLFYINDVKGTCDFLKSSFSMDELTISGLFKDGKFIYGRHRIIIPFIEDDRIIYLRARYFDNGSNDSREICKYKALSNFPGNLTVKRFFNMHKLKQMKRGDQLFLCEGEFDTMIAEQNGMNAIGILGATCYPKDQWHELTDFEMILALDNDEPGRKAAEEISKEIGRPIGRFQFEKYKDLTELLINETGKGK